MPRIKYVATVCEQGVSNYYSSDEKENIEIKEELYDDNEKVRKCFRIYKDGKMYAEIRAVYCVVIEYYQD